MMLQKLRERISARIRNEESGFTLVELLVVMLILGILAAIAIPSFFNQRDKGTDAQAKADVRTAQTAIETYSTDNGGDYTGATPAILVGYEDTLSSTGARLTVPAAGATNYTVSVASETTPAHTFTITRNAGGTIDQTCLPVGEGGCPTDGTWGD
jgi:type IV pilus assembly protein PilA